MPDAPSVARASDTRPDTGRRDVRPDPRAIARRALRTARTRAATEAQAAAALWRSGVLRPDLPHRMLPAAAALLRHGPIGAALSLPVGRFPDRAAVVDEQGTVTYRELDDAATALAAALATRGVGSDDAVGVMCRNHRGFLFALFAGTKLGCRTVLLNTDFAGPQLTDVVGREGLVALIVDEEFDGVTAGLELPRGRFVLPDHVDDAAKPDPLDGDRFVGGKVSAEGRASLAAAMTRRQRLVLLTGGTTGSPKGAPRDFGMTLAIPGGYLEKIPLRTGRSVAVLCPMFHAWGMLSSMLALAVGDTLVLRRKFDPASVLDDLAVHRIDTVIAVPVLLSRLLDELTRHRARTDVGGTVADGHGPDVDVRSVRIIAVSGSALSTDLATRARGAFGDVVYNLYGSTEVAFVTVATPADLAAAPGTVGRAPTGTTVVILDDQGRAVPAGHTGRIFVANTIHFEGYTGGGSKDVVDDMMTTGDLGHLDDAGRLFIDGRSDDMIVSGGENVFPAEVEDLLGTHDGIADVAVVGVDDEDFGQRLRAFVVRADRSGADALDEDGVKAFVKDNLARYKVPRDVRFVSDLPRNQAGKVVKRELPSD